MKKYLYSIAIYVLFLSTFATNSMLQKPYITHVSGTTGSGKTTLSLDIQAHFPSTIICETDGFIQHDTEESRTLLALEDADGNRGSEYKQYWRQVLTYKIRDFLREHASAGVILFFGILNSFGPSDGDIFDLSEVVPVDKRYFLSPPLETLVKQYYLRLSKQDDEYWRRVATGQYDIRGSKQLTAAAKRHRDWHVQKGYDVKSYKEIQAELEHILSEKQNA